MVGGILHFVKKEVPFLDKGTFSFCLRIWTLISRGGIIKRRIHQMKNMGENMDESKMQEPFMGEKQEGQESLQGLLKNLQQKYEIIATLGTTYEEICFIDLVTDRYTVVSENYQGQTGPLREVEKFFIEKNIAEEFKEEAKSFIDFSTISMRLKGKKFISHEFKSQSGRWFLISFVTKKCKEDGEVINILLTARDVTEQKSRELTYQKCLEEALCSIADGYCSINLSKNIVPGVMYQVVDGKKYNLNVQLGLPEDTSFTDLVSAWATTIPEEGVEEFYRNFDRERLLEAFQNGKTQVSFNYWTRTATYEPMLAEDHIEMFHDYETGDVMAFNYVLDRTEQYRLKQQQEQLRQKKMELESALEASNKKNEVIGAISKLYWQVFSVDLEKDSYKEVFTDGRFTMDDPSYVGLVHHDFIKAINKFIDKDFWNQMETFIDHETLSQRLSNTDTISMECLAKSGFWISVRYIVQKRNADGGVDKVLFLLQQIDEQKRKELDYQKRLEESAKKAKLANEAKTNFLRRMSHDIRTPLNGIMGLLKINETHFNDLELVKQNHKKMEASAQHLLSLINDVLQTSKLENGKVILNHEIISLPELSINISSIISGRAIEAGLKWEYEKDRAVLPYPYIYGSPLHLRQIFLNIYGNCIKYNRPGGKIKTAVECLEEDGKSCLYRWIISDTGIGMSKEFLNRIFEPFSQENLNTRSANQGVGLGMSIVKGLIDQMNGTIRITSKEGVGSTFEITIPFDIAADPKEEDKKVLSQKCDMKGIHLLMVEDNELNAEIAQALLADEGAKVEIATNGQEGVERFYESKPGTFDAILMDMMMPVMDGISATKAIRLLQHPDAKSIPIIAMTANAFKEDEIKCLEAGMNAHVAKPLEIEKLKQTICEQVKKK